MSQKTVLLVCNDNDRGVDFLGRAYSQLLDPVGEYLVSKGVRVISAPSTHKSRLVGDVAFNSPRKFSRLETMQFKLAVGKRSKGAIGAGVGARVWRTRLAQDCVDAVLAIQPKPDLCRAGRQLGVPIYDFQHGQISPLNPYYSEFRANITAESCNWAPAGILCWDEVSAECVSQELGIWAANVGHPSLALNIGIGEKAEGRTETKFMHRRGSEYAKHILVLDFYGIPSQEFALAKQMYLTQIAELARLNSSIRFIIRPHPVQFRTNWADGLQLYRHYFGALENVEFPHSASQSPALSLMRRADGIISRGSSAGLVEAKLLSVPSAVVFATRAELSLDYQESYLGRVHFADNSFANILNWLLRLQPRDKTNDANVALEHRNRMTKFLDEVALGKYCK